MTGKVYLVGAGPGDPELLTLKAARVLKHADVVLHDELVGKEILRLAPAHADIRNVGKRCGKKSISQEEINFLMVTLAASGLQVVRLKGGDPLIFGRIGEEIAALRKANIEFEIVPGITAALGAASTVQIPLTHRQSSHALVFLAGHTASEADPTNWRALVSLGATVVIYMPGHDYSNIAHKLRSGWTFERNAMRHHFASHDFRGTSFFNQCAGPGRCSPPARTDFACNRRGPASCRPPPLSARTRTF